MPTVPAVHGAIDCSRGVTLSDGSCIWPSCLHGESNCDNYRLKYTQAKMDCEQRGGTLAIIDTEEKKDHVADMDNPL